MALSLGELVAAIRAQEDMNSVTDRNQNGVNQGSGALGSIIGSIYGMGGLSNVAKPNFGNSNGQQNQYMLKSGG